jgi:hypothetical protein
VDTENDTDGKAEAKGDDKQEPAKTEAKPHVTGAQAGRTASGLGSRA